MELKNITISDIAEDLNLSRSTIDRVINKRGSVAKDTEEKVLNYIEKINYKPNKAAKHLAKKTNYTIGISYFFPEGFAAEIKQGINKIYDELSHYGLNIILKEAHSASQQMEQLEEMEPEIDALMLAAWNQAGLNNFVEKLIEKGKKVATFNRDLPQSNRLFYFGCDYYQAGRLCGELMAGFAEEGSVAIIGDINDKTGFKRISGFKESIQNFGNYNILSPQKITQNYDLDGEVNRNAIKKIKKMISNNRNLTAIYVVNQTLNAAAEALEQSGKVGEIKLIGYDLFEETIELIEKKIVQAVICQEPFNQGYYPIKMLFENFADDRRLQKERYITKLEIVMKENLKYYHGYNYLI